MIWRWWQYPNDVTSHSVDWPISATAYSLVTSSVRAPIRDIVSDDCSSSVSSSYRTVSV